MCVCVCVCVCVLEKWTNLCHNPRVEKALLGITENPQTINENYLFLYIKLKMFSWVKKKRNTYTKSNDNWLIGKENIWNLLQRANFPYL